MKKAYWWRAVNFGDTLTPIILEHFLKEPVEFSAEPGNGRIVGVGSIAHHAKAGDVIWGSGSNRPHKVIDGSALTILALRGPLTMGQFSGYPGIIPRVYGDPAILLSKIYRPEIKKTHAIGYLPHYVDKALAEKAHAEDLSSGVGKMIDIQADWKRVIEEVLSCEKIIASSLHGIIVAEAYGIPAIWIQYSEKIIGGDYKFQDYFLGTGRPQQVKGREIPPIPDLEKKQDALIDALLNHEVHIQK